METTIPEKPEDIHCQSENLHKHLCGLAGWKNVDLNDPGCGYVWQHPESGARVSDKEYHRRHNCPRCGRNNTWKWWSTWLMATIDSREMISRLIENGGYYSKEDTDSPDNPKAEKIVEYTNAAGRRVWGVAFNGDGDVNRYLEPTAYVRDPAVIWTSQEGLVKDPGMTPYDGELTQAEIEKIAGGLLRALGIDDPESIEETHKRAEALSKERGVKADVYLLPDDASPEFAKMYALMSRAKIEDAVVLIDMWTGINKLTNPKMNVVLYAHMMCLVNTFMRVALGMEQANRPDPSDGARKVIKGFGEMLEATFMRSWELRNKP